MGACRRCWTSAHPTTCRAGETPLHCACSWELWAWSPVSLKHVPHDCCTRFLKDRSSRPVTTVHGEGELWCQPPLWSLSPFEAAAGPLQSRPPSDPGGASHLMSACLQVRALHAQQGAGRAGGAGRQQAGAPGHGRGAPPLHLGSGRHRPDAGCLQPCPQVSCCADDGFQTGSLRGRRWLFFWFQKVKARQGKPLPWVALLPTSEAHAFP